MIRMILASCVLRNNAPNSASAADAATSLRIAHVIAIFLFSLMGWSCFVEVGKRSYYVLFGVVYNLWGSITW